MLLFETACMTSGFQPKDPTEFADRVYAIMTESSGLSSASAASAAAADSTPSATEEKAAPAKEEKESVEPEIMPEGGEKKDGAWKDYY